MTELEHFRERLFKDGPISEFGGAEFFKLGEHIRASDFNQIPACAAIDDGISFFAETEDDLIEKMATMGLVPYVSTQDPAHSSLQFISTNAERYTVGGMSYAGYVKLHNALLPMSKVSFNLVENSAMDYFVQQSSYAFYL